MSTSTGNNPNHVSVEAPDIRKVQMFQAGPLLSTLVLMFAFVALTSVTGIASVKNADQLAIASGVFIVVMSFIIYASVRFYDRKYAEGSASITERINADLRSQSGVTLAEKLTLGDYQRVAAVDANGNLSLWSVTPRKKTVELKKLKVSAA